MKKIFKLLLIVSFMIWPLIALAGEKTIELEWEHPDPVAQRVVEFTIYHSLTAGGPYTPLFDVTFSGSQETYSGEGTLQSPDGEETMHYFVATATDDQNNESGYSNEASVEIDFLNPDNPVTLRAIVKVTN